MLLSAALKAGADYIITGDKELLAFDWKDGCPIVTPREFWEVEFPRQLAIRLEYPVKIEDLAGKGYYSVGIGGHQCVALFTSSQLAALRAQE